MGLRRPCAVAAAFAAALLLTICATADATQCLDYAKAAVGGTLVKETFPGRPNFESIAAGDAAVTRLFLIPDHRQCVAQGTDPDVEPPVRSVQAFQVDEYSAFGDGAMQPSLWDLVNRRMTCSGTLSHRQTARDYAQVILHTTSCTLEPRP